ncbi:B12-binding domain-containing radical SAM protein [Desulfovermiculus halophilus]|jgi:radical SAM superfamily enzyme YgiQ (UPF0313 family)|uniref:B12-binding domain-containing radical SAM protein n=1 Tax=Desulfovermiculus halophilus TaxID=339722 RepID=UPI0006863471|nr:B12-binding domain-containing radical SAM protein [Desulfovermiculus halophilus]
MKILLVSPNTESVNMPVYPVGLHLVAEAVQNSGHQAMTMDMFEHPDPWAALESMVHDFQPDAVGISIRNIDDQSRKNTQFFLRKSREVVRGIRRLTSVPVIVGGAGYSIFPDSGLDYLEADMGLAGEGEIALPALLQAMEGTRRYEQVPGLHLPRIGAAGLKRLTSNLDSCPLPGPERLERSRVLDETFWMPYQTRRGCPLDCSYCSTGSIEGRVIRHRDPDAVAANLLDFQKSGVRRVFFVDNTFNLPRRYAKELCRSMIRTGLDLTWCAIVYPKYMDRELAELMARAGCSQVSLGFESGSPPILAALNKRFTPDEVRHSSDCLAAAGIRRMGFLLLGGPGETRQTVEQSLEFAESLHLEALKITVGIRIYPATRLAGQAREEGLIRPQDPLLHPRFYLNPELSEWLPEYVRAWSAERPGLVLP